MALELPLTLTKRDEYVPRPQEQGFIQAGDTIQIPPSLYQTWTGQQQPKRIPINQNTILGIPAIKRCCEILSELTSDCSCAVYTRDENGRTFARQHPLWKILRQKANPNCSFKDWVRQIVFDRSWNGNGYGIFRDGFLWNIDPVDVQPVIVHTPTTQAVTYVVKREGQEELVNASQMIHLRGLGHQCGIVGVSAVQYCRQMLEVSLETQRYASNYFSVGGMNNIIIEIPENAAFGSEQYKELLKTLNRIYAGGENTNGPLILTQGAKANRTQKSNDDAQFIASRKMTMLDAALIIGMEPSLVGYRDGNTSYNSISADRENARGTTFEPILTALEFQLNDKGLSEFEKETETTYIEFNRDDLTKADPQEERKLLLQEMLNRAISWEEYRECRNMRTDNEETEQFFHQSSTVVEGEEPEPPQIPVAPPVNN